MQSTVTYTPANGQTTRNMVRNLDHEAIKLHMTAFMILLKGKGTQVWKKTGAIYDGDWQADLRHGFGTYSIKKAEGIYMKEYAGGWKNDLRHVSSNGCSLIPRRIQREGMRLL